jgi:hypothetical protein
MPLDCTQAEIHVLTADRETEVPAGDMELKSSLCALFALFGGVVHPIKLDPS